MDSELSTFIICRMPDYYLAFAGTGTVVLIALTHVDGQAELT